MFVLIQQVVCVRASAADKKSGCTYLIHSPRFLFFPYSSCNFSFLLLSFLSFPLCIWCATFCIKHSSCVSPHHNLCGPMRRGGGEPDQKSPCTYTSIDNCFVLPSAYTIFAQCDYFAETVEIFAVNHTHARGPPHLPHQYQSKSVLIEIVMPFFDLFTSYLPFWWQICGICRSRKSYFHSECRTLESTLLLLLCCHRIHRLRKKSKKINIETEMRMLWPLDTMAQNTSREREDGRLKSKGKVVVQSGWEIIID